MKKLFISAAIAACFAVPKAKSQAVNGVRLTEIKVDYIKVEPIYNGSETYIVKIDYGQKIKRDKDLIIRDDNGNDLLFNSQIDCLNKLVGYGYELFNTYTVPIFSDSNRPVFVMKRR